MRSHTPSTLRRARFALAFLGLACSTPEGDGPSVHDGGPEGDDAGRNAGPGVIEGTLVEGSPLCADPVPCCQPDAPALLGVTATSASVASIERTADQTLVHLAIADEMHALSFLVEPDLEVDDELELERTALGLVVRDELGVVAVFGATSGDAGFDAEVAFAETTLRPALSCHGFVLHQGFSYGCADALIADYALQIGDVQVAHAERADVVLSEGTFHVQNDLIRRRVPRGEGYECGDYWIPTMLFTVTRRAK